MYISHMRSEGNRLLEAVDELIEISRRAKLPAEIYHLKAAGQQNWGKLDAAIKKVEDARASGLKITADMYTYTAGATGLDAAMPPWVQEGGLEGLDRAHEGPGHPREGREGDGDPHRRLGELLRRRRVPEKILLVAFKNDKLKPLTGKTLAEVAKMRGKSPAGDRDGPGDRGRQPGRHRLLPDVRGQRQEGDRPPLGELRLGRRGPRDRGGVPEVQPPPARLRQLRPPAGQATCATRR